MRTGFKVINALGTAKSIITSSLTCSNLRKLLKKQKGVNLKKKSQNTPTIKLQKPTGSFCSQSNWSP